MDKLEHTIVSSHDLDGDTWEIRVDDSPMYTERYCSHITCTFKHNGDIYAGLWSWEMDDLIEADNGLPWCHFCHTPVPDGLMVIMTLLEENTRCTVTSVKR